jgi:hypothetical protein
VPIEIGSGAARLLALAMLCAAPGGCLTGQPFLQQGNATSAEIVYSGDVASAEAVARRHCASYERTARLIETGGGIAYFACDSR